MSQHNFEPLLAQAEADLAGGLVATKIESTPLELLELRSEVAILKRRLLETQHALDQRRQHQSTHKELRDEFALAIYCKGGLEWSQCYLLADQGLKARLAK